MTSAIDPTKPEGTVGQSADLRANLGAAKSEIEALQDGTAALETRTTALESASAAAGMFSPPDPAGTNSTAYRMMGLGGALTPTRSGRIQVTVDGQLHNTSNGQQTTTVICVGTGTAPANGDLQAGATIIGQPARFEATSGGAPFVPFSLTVLLPGLTAGIAYWIDLAVRVTGGTGSVSDINLTAIEVP